MAEERNTDRLNKFLKCNDLKVLGKPKPQCLVPLSYQLEPVFMGGSKIKNMNKESNSGIMISIGPASHLRSFSQKHKTEQNDKWYKLVNKDGRHLT